MMDKKQTHKDAIEKFNSKSIRKSSIKSTKQKDRRDMENIIKNLKSRYK